MSLARVSAGTTIDSYSENRAGRWLLAIVALGLAARVFRWALCFPLWSDEAFLSASFLQRGYSDMFRPLEYHQVCPLGFLWAQLSVVKLLGFSESSLRLVPLAASVAALLLFVRLASRVLTGAALVLAVAVFSFSYPGLRYAAEAKPYAVDALVSVALLTLAVEWLRRGHRRRWLWALAAATPLAIALSFPAVFVAGAISLAGLLTLLRRPGKGGWIGWLAFNLAVAGSLLAMYFWCIRPQSSAELAGIMRPYWGPAFPPLTAPLRLAAWLFWTHTGDMLGHPVGGPNGASLVTAIACALALVVLCRRRRATLLILALAPLALNFIAAAAHRYPYGGHVRVALYLMPLVCLLAGLGVAVVLDGLARARAEWAGWMAVLLVVMALVPIGSAIRDVASPGRTPSDARTRDFARWFWPEQSRDAELVCLKSDWHQNLAPQTFDFLYSSLYLCNQGIYSPRHHRGEPPRLDRVSAEHPLRCVQYHSQKNPLDQPAVDAWLARMEPQWRLVARRQYRITHADKRDQTVADVTKIELWEFVPRTVSSSLVTRP